MENEIIVANSNLPALQATPEEWARRRQEFNKWVNTQLREGVDFGQIPGTDKPTLLKPGAEKIAQIYGCAPEFEITKREQDPSTGYMYVESLVRLVNVQTGATIGSGIGCCSSYESKYRWRWEWWNGRGQPTESDGWEQTRNGKWRRRIENRDLVDVWNTVIKIAKKRAFVDAALTVSGASEKFTQDVEDFVEDEFTPAPAPSQPLSSAPAPKAVQPSVEVQSDTINQSTPPWDVPEPPQGWITWSPAAQKRFWAVCNDLNLSSDAVHHEFGVQSMKDCTLSLAEVGMVLKALECGMKHSGLGLNETKAALQVMRMVDVARLGITEEQCKARINTYIAKRADEGNPVPQQAQLEVRGEVL